MYDIFKITHFVLCIVITMILVSSNFIEEAMNVTKFNTVILFTLLLGQFINLNEESENN